MAEILKMSRLRHGFRSGTTAPAAQAQANPTTNLADNIASLFANAFTPRETEISFLENRKALIAIQWFVAIGTSYLILSSQQTSLDAPLPLLLIFLCLISAPIVQRLPANLFRKRWIESKLLIFDSILILAAIGLTQIAPWDLLVLFFLCVFIAATGENLIHIVIGCTLLSIVFLVFVTSKQFDVSAINSDLLVRIPFMLGISVFYGHLTSQVKREKKRVEKMKEAEELKRQLVCALAHDVKAPLSVILGHAELLAGCFGGRPDPTEQVSSLECIRENVDRIVKLVTGFLNVSKTATAAEEASQSAVDMNALVKDVIRQQTVSLQKKDLNVRLELDDNLQPCLGDRSQLERVIWNLIDNAVKFTPQGGTITLTSRMIANHLSISVKDSGVGIPKEELSNLFHEFQRLKGSANTEGTGLGLFIVKTIVDAHKGTIAVESEEGVGTSFNIVLPAREFG